MEDLLQEVAAGKAKGIRRWYAVAHAARCSHCGTFLSRLKITINVLRDAHEKPNPEAIERLREKVKQLQDS